MDEKYINLLIKLAKKAEAKGEVPIAAIVVKENKIISKAYNKKNKSHIAIDHAEIIAIRRACRKLKTWRLNECSIYVTLEPCKMCYAAIAETRMKKVIFLLNSKYYNVENSNFYNLEKKKIEENKAYNDILSNFFKKRR